MSRGPRGHLGGAISVLALAPTALGQVFDLFPSVPPVYTQSPEVFAALFRDAHCTTVRSIMLGDSQETTPGGQGAIYVPRLNYELFLSFGNAPETPIVGARGSTGGGLPYADWLIRQASAAPGLSDTRLPATAIPPGITPGASSLANGNNINNNQWYGGLFLLQHDAADTDPAANLSHQHTYFDLSAGAYLDVYAATHPDSGEVICRLTPCNGHACNYYRPTLATYTSSMGLDSPVPSIRKQRFGPFNTAGNPYMQVELYGSDPTRLTDLVAAQFVSAADDRGWSISSLSAGGYRANSYLDNHADSIPMLHAFQPDVIFLAYGANDAGNGVTTQQFHDNLVTLISALRNGIRPGLPFIILTDPRRNINPDYADAYDRYAGVAYAIAQADPLVCAVNSRRLTEEAGWNAAGFSQFVADDVHYTPAGAILKAQLEINALYSAFGSRCPADLDDGTLTNTPDCGVDINDLLYFLAAFESGDISADLDNDADPTTGSPDGGVDINDLLYFLARFELGC